MKAKAIGKDPRLLFGISFISCLIFTAGILFYRDPYYFPRSPEDSGNNLNPPPHPGLLSRHVMLPAGYDFTQETLDAHLAGTSAKSWKLFQLDKNQVLDKPPMKPVSYKPSLSRLYGETPMESAQFAETMEIGVSESMPIPADLENLFKIFHEEAELYGNTYYQRLKRVFDDHMTTEDVPKKWFRFNGSSVWLKAYNVHLVVSRLSYSRVNTSKKAVLSMVLAQVFDADWNEIEDVRLVVPTNDNENPLTFEQNGQRFILQRFPCILPVPFKIGTRGKFWGAEDPRTVLVRNKNGYDEPMVIFNAMHDKQVSLGWWAKLQVIRSMFMTFPFQSQQGAGAEMGEISAAGEWFSRTKEIKVASEKERKVEKNWIPLLSETPKYEEKMTMVTLLDPLRIVTCELWTDSLECRTVHSSSESAVGPLRGGTPLVRVSKLSTKGTEVFVGLARAHLSRCCSKSFYRPNLVVVSHTGESWTLTHVSSFIDLGLKIVPLPGQRRPCQILNAMIPNGIESWDVETDTMSLFASVSDMTVERLEVHGVIEMLQGIESKELKLDGKIRGPVKGALGESKKYCEAYARDVSLVFF